MTPNEKELLRSSFALVAPSRTWPRSASSSGCARRNPSLGPQFAHTDMTGQRKALMQTLAVTVASLDKLDTLFPAVQALGRRHAGYGVRDEDYKTVGAVLLDTLDMLLGTAFTRAVREAWAAAYALLSEIMRQSAAEGEAGEPARAAA